MSSAKLTYHHRLNPLMHLALAQVVLDLIVGNTARDRVVPYMKRHHNVIRLRFMRSSGKDEERRLLRHWHDQLGKQQGGIAQPETGLATPHRACVYLVFSMSGSRQVLSKRGFSGP